MGPGYVEAYAECTSKELKRPRRNESSGAVLCLLRSVESSMYLVALHVSTPALPREGRTNTYRDHFTLCRTSNGASWNVQAGSCGVSNRMASQRRPSCTYRRHPLCNDASMMPACPLLRPPIVRLPGVHLERPTLQAENLARLPHLLQRANEFGRPSVGPDYRWIADTITRLSWVLKSCPCCKGRVADDDHLFDDVAGLWSA